MDENRVPSMGNSNFERSSRHVLEINKDIVFFRCDMLIYNKYNDNIFDLSAEKKFYSKLTLHFAHLILRQFQIIPYFYRKLFFKIFRLKFLSSGLFW